MRFYWSPMVFIRYLFCSNKAGIKILEEAPAFFHDVFRKLIHLSGWKRKSTPCGESNVKKKLTKTNSTHNPYCNYSLILRFTYRPETSGDVQPVGSPDEYLETVSSRASRQSWARLIQKVYEIDPMCMDARVSAKPGDRAKQGSARGKGDSRPLVRPKCGYEMSKMPVVPKVYLAAPAARGTSNCNNHWPLWSKQCTWMPEKKQCTTLR